MRPIKGNLDQLKKLRKQFTREIKKQEELKKAVVAPSTAATLSDEDKRLFRQSVKGVTPINDTRRLAHRAARLKNPEFYHAKREQAEGAPILMQPRRTKVEPSKKLSPHQIAVENDSYLAQGMGKDVLKKLQQVYWPIEATLDLHGFTLEQAADRFNRFLGTCIEFEVRCFLVIHGKGHGSKEGQSILKSYLTAFLRDIEKIAAFIPAPEHLGGEGALLIVCKTDKSFYVESTF